jgi:phosphoribosylformimino-5-aminoimidazole carboxamide ribotide isomerase
VLLIPAIDLRAGRCVRLVKGDFAAETHYPIDPGELLRRYQRLGASWVHVVDLDGARDGARANGPIIARLARARGLRLQVGGGVRTAEAIAALLGAGVARVVVGSAAVERPSEVREWLRRFGAERICLAFDVRTDDAGDACVFTHGWTQPSAVSLSEAVQAFASVSLKHVLCTAIDRDGTLAGPDLALYAAAVARFPDLSWQASGGVRSAADLAALARVGVTAVVSGKALLDERITHEEIRTFLPDASSPASTYAPATS